MTLTIENVAPFAERVAALQLVDTDIHNDLPSLEELRPFLAKKWHFTMEMQDGDEQEALALARRLFAVYDTGIDSLSLVPSEQPGLALFFNDRLVASHQRDGRAPTVADIRALFSREGIIVVRRPG